MPGVVRLSIAAGGHRVYRGDRRRRRGADWWSLMTVVLDTTALPARDRKDALISAMIQTSGASQVTLDRDTDQVHGRMDLWRFGAAALFRNESTGISMRRNSSAARATSEGVIAIGVQEKGAGRHRTASATRVVRPGGVLLIDITDAFDFGWAGVGASRALQVPTAELALPMDVIRRGATRLASSPLCALVSQHIAQLTRDADALAGSGSAASLGSASIELARALIASAGAPDELAHDVVEQSLITQVRAYVRQHLADPDLGPAEIAAALAVSPRQLYRACARSGISLEQWIIDARLDAARAELARPEARYRSIESVAWRWGFKDTTHFTRRFKLRFGMLPSHWRRDPRGHPDSAADR